MYFLSQSGTVEVEKAKVQSEFECRVGVLIII